MTETVRQGQPSSSKVTQDGLAALAQIVASDPEARVIMCSALDHAPTVLDALRIGAKGFVVKPLRRARLLTAAGRALA